VSLVCQLLALLVLLQ